MLPQDTYKHKGLRKKLVEILIAKGITQKEVLKAMLRVPRHYFMDSAFIAHAYEDKAFGIGEGQTISQPFTVAFQSQLLGIKPKEKILEIGTGSGYQSSILLEMGAHLYTIEFHRTLHNKAKKLLTAMGYQAYFYCGDGSQGLESAAPFHKIIVTAGAPAIPEPLVNQLHIGGKLIIPVGDAKSQKMLCIIKKDVDDIEVNEFGKFSFVKLVGESGWG